MTLSMSLDKYSKTGFKWQISELVTFDEHDGQRKRLKINIGNNVMLLLDEDNGKLSLSAWGLSDGDLAGVIAELPDIELGKIYSAHDKDLKKWSKSGQT